MCRILYTSLITKEGICSGSSEQTHSKHEGQSIVIALSETRTLRAPLSSAQFHLARVHTTIIPQLAPIPQLHLHTIYSLSTILIHQHQCFTYSAYYSTSYAPRKDQLSQDPASVNHQYPYPTSPTVVTFSRPRERPRHLIHGQ